MMIRLLALTLALAFAGTASARDLFVSPIGKDTNSGRSEAAAWRTIGHAAKNVRPGDTVTVADGKYVEGVIDLNVSGTKAKPIVFTGANYKGPKLRGALRVTGDWVVVQYFDVTNPDTGDYGISTWESHNVIINGNEVHDCRGGGIGVNRSDYVTVQGNVSYNNARLNPEQHSGISVWQPLDLYDPPAGEGRTFGIIVRNNSSFYNYNDVPHPVWDKPSDGHGIILDDFKDHKNPDGVPYTKGALVENNLCHNNGGATVHVYQSAENIVIRHNTGYDNVYGLQWTTGEINISRSAGIDIYNNNLVCTAPRTDGVAANQAQSQRITWRNNNLFRAGGGAVRGFDPKVGDNVSFNPKFIDPTNELGRGFDFRLKAGSRAIDAGLVNPWLPWDDRDWADRVSGDGPDLGCFEFAAD